MHSHTLTYTHRHACVCFNLCKKMCVFNENGGSSDVHINSKKKCDRKKGCKNNVDINCVPPEHICTHTHTHTYTHTYCMPPKHSVCRVYRTNSRVYNSRTLVFVRCRHTLSRTLTCVLCCLCVVYISRTLMMI